MTTKAYRDAVKYAKTIGLVSVGWNGEGHHVFRNPDTGDTCSISGSMADQSRAMENTLAVLRRCAGIDKRGQDSVEGERRDKRTPRRLGSGFSFEAVRRDRSRKRPTKPGYTTGDLRADLVAAREAAWLELMSLKTRTARAEELVRRVVHLDELLGGSDDAA